MKTYKDMYPESWRKPWGPGIQFFYLKAVTTESQRGDVALLAKVTELGGARPGGL